MLYRVRSGCTRLLRESKLMLLSPYSRIRQGQDFCGYVTVLRHQNQIVDCDENLIPKSVLSENSWNVLSWDMGSKDGN